MDVFECIDRLIQRRTDLPIPAEPERAATFDSAGLTAVAVLREAREGNLPSASFWATNEPTRIAVALGWINRAGGEEFVAPRDLNYIRRYGPPTEIGGGDVDNIAIADAPRDVLIEFAWFQFTKAADLAVNCLLHTEGRGYTYLIAMDPTRSAQAEPEFWEREAVAHLFNLEVILNALAVA